jgi:hypothetical protein
VGGVRSADFVQLSRTEDGQPEIGADEVVRGLFNGVDETVKITCRLVQRRSFLPEFRQQVGLEPGS